MSARASSDMSCGFQGNPDVYGIGIRVGFYTQALAAWFANYFVASEARSLRPANLLYTLALFVSIVIYASQPGDVHAIEIFLILTFLFCTGVIAVSSRQPRYSARYLEESIGYSVSFHVLTFLGLVFSNWYWWTGIDLYLPTPCGTFVWVVVRVDIYGWLRKLSQACNVIAIIYAVYFLLDSLGGLLKRRATRRVKGLFLDDVYRHRAIYKRDVYQIADVKMFKRDMMKARSLWNRPSAAKRRAPQQAPAFERVYQAEQFLESVTISIREENLLSPETMLVRWNQINKALEPKGPEVLQFYVWLIRNYGAFRQLDMAIRVVQNRHKVSIPSLPLDVPVPRNRALPSLFNVMNTIHGVVQHTAMLRLDPLLAYGVALTAIKPVVMARDNEFWKWVDLASRVKRSQLPLKTRQEWHDYAVLELLILACLIVQVETCLVWNQVQGINTIQSFGQLLAFFVGVSGLSKVVYRKISDRINGIDEESKQPDPDPFDEDIDVYLEWKKSSNGLARSSSF